MIIAFWCKWWLNYRSFIWWHETLPVELTKTHKSTITLVCVWVGVCCVSVSAFSFFFFFFFFFFHAFSPHLWLLFMYGTWTVAATFDQFSMNNISVYCSRTHKFHFLSIFSLKMSPTALFTHLKIILLQWFQQ